MGPMVVRLPPRRVISGADSGSSARGRAAHRVPASVAGDGPGEGTRLAPGSGPRRGTSHTARTAEARGVHCVERRGRAASDPAPRVPAPGTACGGRDLRRHRDPQRGSRRCPFYLPRLRRARAGSATVRQPGGGGWWRSTRSAPTRTTAQPLWAACSAWVPFGRRSSPRIRSSSRASSGRADSSPRPRGSRGVSRARDGSGWPRSYSSRSNAPSSRSEPSARASPASSTMSSRTALG
jgi:hypothetical protein